MAEIPLGVAVYHIKFLFSIEPDFKKTCIFLSNCLCRYKLILMIIIRRCILWFVSFSQHINQTRKKYYQAYRRIEDNTKISDVIYITPFLIYFAESIYNHIEKENVQKTNQITRFQDALTDEKSTEKEKDLWNFVLSAYGQQEFSTKQLEKDFGNTAYANIRSFVLKFTEMELLTSWCMAIE